MRAHFLFFFCGLILLAGCKKETEEFQTEALADFLPTQTGKYITYRIDSTIFINFGGNMVTRSYEEKHQVDALLTDNLGRPSYRVFRFIRDVGSTAAWQPSGSYFITPVNNTIEVIENNLRVIKLAAAIKEEKTWKGYQFLSSDAYASFYPFGNDDAMGDWESTYTDINAPLTLGSKTFANTITVEQVIFEPVTNVKANFQVDNTQHFGSQSYAVEKYAKGVGLIYQEIIMWEYQPPSAPRTGYAGFGIKRSIIDYN